MKTIKSIGLCLAIALELAISLLWAAPKPVLAIDEPDSTPSIANKWVWRNVLENNDMLIIIYENTPYATTPDVPYSEAFIWRLISANGTTELGQAVGYNYNEYGYGYNVIGFYFSASENITWGENYYLKLSGTPAAFAEPPEYVYQLSSGDYSSLTDAEDIEDDIESKILQIAADLENKWGLSVDYELLEQSEVGMVLSIYGESFFRGALYGLQAYAPDVFRLVIGNIDPAALTDRTWTDNYSESLPGQYPGSAIEEGMQAGNDFLDVTYNLFGLLLTLGFIGILITVCLTISGDWWGSVCGGVAPMVIFTRMGLFGMGELALVTALGWLFFSAKMWKLI
jgi:hypothetical protein